MKRGLWALVKPALRCIPRHFYALRNAALRLCGAKIGEQVRIYPSADFFYPWNVGIDDFATISWDVRIYSLAHIHIKTATMISQNAHLCAGSHDYTQDSRPLTLEPITIGENALG